MKKPVYHLNDLVTHVLDGTKVGLVVALVQRFDGYTYRVCWAPTEDEKNYFAEEINMHKKAIKLIGFKR